MTYTIDGDLYRTERRISISVGPPIVFVKPAAALIVRERGDTMEGTDEHVVSAGRQEGAVRR